MVKRDGERFDLILMDLRMPGMDGVSTARAIRRVERMRSTPILTVTGALGEAGMEERCRTAGMDAVLAKPVTLEQLSQALESLSLAGTSPILTESRTRSFLVTENGLQSHLPG